MDSTSRSLKPLTAASPSAEDIIADGKGLLFSARVLALTSPQQLGHGREQRRRRQCVEARIPFQPTALVATIRQIVPPTSPFATTKPTPAQRLRPRFKVTGWRRPRIPPVCFVACTQCAVYAIKSKQQCHRQRQKPQIQFSRTQPEWSG
jgi:hypothetical protein